MDLAKILETKYPNEQWHLIGNDYAGLTWLSDTPKPTKAKLDSLWAEVQQEIADEQTAKAAARQATLDKLGLTADEAAALFG